MADYILATDTPDYQDLWYTLYEDVRSYGYPFVARLMEEMDPTLTEEDNEIG